MPSFEDRHRKPGKRDESRDRKRDEGRRSTGHSYGSPSSGQRSERQPGSSREGSHEKGRQSARVAPASRRRAKKKRSRSLRVWNEVRTDRSSSREGLRFLSSERSGQLVPIS
jgi:hypothetical protein